MCLVLLVRLTADDYRRLTRDRGSYTSRDEHRGPVAQLLDRRRIAAPSQFACVGAFCGNPRSTNSIAGYGTVIGFLDPDRVLQDIFVVAEGDLQNCAVNGRDSRVHEVTGTPDERRRILLMAAGAVGDLGYAEARVGRPLVADDFLNFDTSGDFELNLGL